MENSKVNKITAEITEELQKAMKKFPSIKSVHEGYAVLLEEVDEAWDAIKKNDIVHTRKEMIQVAAMAIRFIHDVTMTKDDVIALQRHMNEVGISPTDEERAEWAKFLA
jgi:GTP1/Obg family GTP-binding protein